MASNQRRWLHYGLAVAAIVCSVISLFALTEGASRWTTPLNVLSIVLIVLAVKTRRQGSSSSDS